MAVNYNYFVLIGLAALIGFFIFKRMQKPREASLEFAPAMTKSTARLVDDEFGECEILNVRRVGENKVNVNFLTKNKQAWTTMYQRDTFKPINVEEALIGALPVYKGIKIEQPRRDAYGESNYSEVAEAQRKAAEATAKSNYITEHHERDIFEYIEAATKGKATSPAVQQQPPRPG